MTLTIENLPRWCPEAERGLSETLGYDRDAIALAVDNGVCQLWKLWDGKSYAVTRIELGVLTCCCYQGINCQAWMDWLMDQGARMGLKAVQFYSKRPAFARMFERYNFVALETVYRAEVPANGAIFADPASTSPESAGDAAARTTH